MMLLATKQTDAIFFNPTCLYNRGLGNNTEMKNVNISEEKVVKTLLNFTKTNTEIDPLAPFVATLFNHVTNKNGRDVVIVCFGTNAISGDALGPMVGTLLTKKYSVPAFVYGTDEAQINGKNMGEWIAFIQAVHEGALFVAVDASLGSKDKVGQIVLREDGVCPSGVTGKTERFGDVGILGIVAHKHGDALMQLMTVSQLYVEKLADEIAILLKSALA